MSKTYAITQQECKDFFSKDITIRQKEKLAFKIFCRLEFLEELCDGPRLFDSVDDICRNFYRDSRIGNNNGLGIYSDMLDDLLPMRALWDDNLVAKLQQFKKQQELDEEKEEQNIIDIYVRIFDKLTEKDIQHLENLDYLKMALKRRKDKETS